MPAAGAKGASKRGKDLYGNEIRIKSGDEVGEVGPVVFDSKEKAVGIPSHKLQRLLLLITFFSLRIILSWLLHRPI